MFGIYKITNKLNNNAYIGKSNNIEKRWATHKQRAFYKNSREYEKALYRAFRKYGLENFSFEVLEEVNSDEEASEREQYWIKYYDTYHNGYNETIGGEIGNMQHGETHTQAKLTEEDVIKIRNAYNNHERCKEVYKDFQDKIEFNGFHKVWKGETWKHVKMEVYTKENKEFHLHNTGQSGQENGKAKLKDQDVYNIRLRKKNGESPKNVYEDYKNLITYGSFQNIWYNCNWKHIVV